MTPMLMFMDGRDEKVELTLSGLVIGRSQECAIRTDDPMVSRKNTRIAFSGGRWCVEDLGSSNGTYINEVAVQRQAIEHGDVIRCGSVRLRFMLHAEALQPLAPVATMLSPPALAPEPMPTPVAAPSAELETLRAENTELQEQADGLRLRLGELERKQSHHHDEVQALTSLGNELAAETRALKEEREQLQQRVRELEEELQGRDRQLERAQEDVTRHQQEAEEARAQLGEAKRVADDGWKQLKAANAEMDKIKRVMAQQEALLDQRRMGLTALETTAQELRREREELLRVQLSLVHERDELRRELGARQPAAYALTMQLSSPDRT